MAVVEMDSLIEGSAIMAGKVAKAKKEALRVARYLGHEMGSWHRYNSKKMTAVCQECGDSVVVDFRPLYDPDGKIWGPAVTYFCGEKKMREELKEIQESIDGDCLDGVELTVLENRAREIAKEFVRMSSIASLRHEN